MTVREMIKEAYAGGELREFIDEGVCSRQLAIMDTIAGAFEEPETGPREATVCFPYGRQTAPEVVCLPKEVLMKRYRPSCPGDMERLRYTVSSDERSYLMNKVVRKLLLAHHDLSRGWDPDRESFLSAEVPEPLRVDPATFVKAVICKASDLPLAGPDDEDGVAVRVVDLMKAAISREMALCRAHRYFSEDGMDRFSLVVEQLKEAMVNGPNEPFVIRGKKSAQEAILEELLKFSDLRKKETAVIIGDELGSLSADDAFDLEDRWIFVKDLDFSRLDPKAEDRLMLLTAFGDRIAVLTSEEGALTFGREDLKIMYKNYHDYSIGEVSE